MAAESEVDQLLRDAGIEIDPRPLLEQLEEIVQNKKKYNTELGFIENGRKGYLQCKLVQNGRRIFGVDKTLGGYILNVSHAALDKATNEASKNVIPTVLEQLLVKRPDLDGVRIEAILSDVWLEKIKSIPGWKVTSDPTSPILMRAGKKSKRKVKSRRKSRRKNK